MPFAFFVMGEISRGESDEAWVSVFEFPVGRGSTTFEDETEVLLLRPDRAFKRRLSLSYVVGTGAGLVLSLGPHPCVPPPYLLCDREDLLLTYYCLVRPIHLWQLVSLRVPGASASFRGVVQEEWFGVLERREKDSTDYLRLWAFSEAARSIDVKAILQSGSLVLDHVGEFENLGPVEAEEAE